jgi:hypothetical protein
VDQDIDREGVHMGCDYPVVSRLLLQAAPAEIGGLVRHRAPWTTLRRQYRQAVAASVAKAVEPGAVATQQAYRRNQPPGEGPVVVKYADVKI